MQTHGDHNYRVWGCSRPLLDLVPATWAASLTMEGGRGSTRPATKTSRWRVAISCLNMSPYRAMATPFTLFFKIAALSRNLLYFDVVFGRTELHLLCNWRGATLYLLISNTIHKFACNYSDSSCIAPNNVKNTSNDVCE